MEHTFSRSYQRERPIFLHKIHVFPMYWSYRENQFFIETSAVPKGSARQMQTDWSAQFWSRCEAVNTIARLQWNLGTLLIP